MKPMCLRQGLTKHRQTGSEWDDNAPSLHSAGTVIVRQSREWPKQLVGRLRTEQERKTEEQTHF